METEREGEIQWGRKKRRKEWRKKRYCVTSAVS